MEVYSSKKVQYLRKHYSLNIKLLFIHNYSAAHCLSLSIVWFMTWEMIEKRHNKWKIKASVSLEAGALTEITSRTASYWNEWLIATRPYQLLPKEKKLPWTIESIYLNVLLLHQQCNNNNNAWQAHFRKISNQVYVSSRRKTSTS